MNIYVVMLSILALIATADLWVTTNTQKEVLGILERIEKIHRQRLDRL